MVELTIGLHQIIETILIISEESEVFAWDRNKESGRNSVIEVTNGRMGRLQSDGRKKI